MMECAGAGNPAQFRVTARPNSAVGNPGLGVAMIVLLPSCTVVGLGLLMLGAWPAALFMALPLLGLAWAFRRIQQHAGDFERLTLDDDRLIVDSHSADGDQHLEFNSHWVQVALRRSAVGGGMTLTLRSHGREAIFGRLLSD